MKKLLITFSLLCSSLLHAQDVKIKWGDPFEMGMYQLLPDVLFATNNNSKLYTCYLNKKDNIVTPYLATFNRDLAPHKSQAISAAEGDNLSYISTNYFSGYFFMLTSRYDKQKKSTSLLYQKIDKDLQPEGKNTEIFNLEGEVNYSDKLTIKYSEDSTKMCIMVIKNSTKNENCKMIFKVYDEKYNVVIDKISEKAPDSKYDYGNGVRFMVNNKGDAYLIYKIFNNDEHDEFIQSASGKKDASGYKTVFLKFQSDKDPVAIPIDDEGKFIKDYFVSADHTGNPVVVMVYGEYYKLKRYGIKVFRIDNASDKITLKTTNEFSQSVIDRYDKIGTPSKEDISTYLLSSITDFKLYDDLSMAIIFEEFDTKRNWCNSIFIVKLNKESAIDWTVLIPKWQSVAYGNSHRHNTMFFNDKIYIFYNDALKNKDYDIANATEKPRVFATGTAYDENLTMVEVDDLGKLKKSILATSQDIDIHVDISKSKQLNANTMLLCGRVPVTTGINLKFSGKLGTIDFK